MPDRKLNRTMGMWMAPALVIGNMVGSGIFLLPASLPSADLRLIPTGGDRFEAEREQWDDGNNVLAVEPGVVHRDPLPGVLP
jgi:hypothetical protein